MSTGRKVSELEWQNYKAEIEALYIKNDQTLEKVMEFMKERHGFSASKQQYVRRLAQWNFVKNTTHENWAIIGHKIHKRQKCGKDSEVHIRGKLIPDKRVTKETSRHARSSWDEFSQAVVSPATPVDIIVCSPKGQFCKVDSFLNIPWFRFLRTWNETVSRTPLAVKEDHHLLRQYIWHDLDEGSNIAIPALSDVNMIVAEDQDNKHTLLEKGTRCVSRVITGVEYIQAIIFLSSNNFLNPHHIGGFLEWIDHINGRWILSTILLPRTSTTEILAQNLLSSVVKINDLKAVRFLLSLGADPNFRNSEWNFVPLPFTQPGFPSAKAGFKSPIREAIGTGNISIIKLLLDAGAEVNTRLNSGFDSPTPLQEAVVSADAMNLVPLLLERGANVNVITPTRLLNKTADTPPLSLAVISNNVQLVQTLLRAGALVNQWSFYYGTALQIAVASDNMEMVRILLKEHADVNAPSKLSIPSKQNGLDLFLNHCSWISPLILATRNGNIAMIKLLLQAGADIDVCRDHQDKKFLWELAKVFQRHRPGIHINEITNTALQCALHRENYELVQFLLRAGSSVDTHEYGDTVLQIAAHSNDIAFTKLLLSYRAKVYAPALWPNERTAIQVASARGNLILLRHLLNATTHVLGFMSINAPPSPIGGRTALQGAAENGHANMVEFLLELGANVNGPIAEQNGTTTLQAAARSRNLHIVELVLAVGADTSTPSGTISAVVIAIRQNDLPMFHMLLQHGVDIDTYPTEYEFSALQRAVMEESTTFLQVLISTGADVNQHWCRSGAEATALQTALRYGRIDAVKLLLQAGADVNVHDKHGEDGGALLVAIQEGCYDGAKLLLQAGANVNPRAETGHSKCSAIAEAASKLDIDMVTLLLQYGADPNVISGPNGHTALGGAIIGSFSGGPVDEMVQLLLDAGAKVNVRVGATDIDALPGSILAVAAQSGSISVVRTLISSGADPNWRYSLDDWTALQCAISSRCDDIINIILEEGADVNALPSLEDGRTALQQVASQGNLELVQLLLRKGAIVNAPPGRVRGVTALQAASIMGHLDIVIQLLHAGASINSAASENGGRTALQGAAEMGRLDIVHLLLENDNDMEGFYDRCHDAAVFANKNRHPVIATLLKDYRKI